MILFYYFWITNIKGYIFLLILTSVFSIITIFCTGQMYATLKTIPSWNNPLVTPLYVLNGITIGSLFVYSLNFFYDHNLNLFEKFIYIIIIINFLSKVIYWISIKKKSNTNIETAVGIKSNDITFFEGPHTGKNFLTTEMINTISNQNSNFLRMVVCILSFITPLYMINQYATLVTDPFILKISMFIMFILALIGMIIERYLFFIQSKHVVGLYYGEKN